MAPYVYICSVWYFSTLAVCSVWYFSTSCTGVQCGISLHPVRVYSTESKFRDWRAGGLYTKPTPENLTLPLDHAGQVWHVQAGHHGGEAVYRLLIREVRLDAGISQGMLARLAGTTQATVSRLESGTRAPSMSALAALAKALECEMGDLVALVRP